MKAAAPQAPVPESGKTVKAGKTSGLKHFLALGRGLHKGSASFQLLMNARAAEKSAVPLPLPAGEGVKETQQGADALKIPRQSAAHARVPAGLPVSGTVAKAAEEAEEKEKTETAPKPVRLKPPGLRVPAVLVAVGQVSGQPVSPQKAPGPGKEQKPDTPGLSKAPVPEARAMTSGTEPLIRILDLRRSEKPRVSFETGEPRKGETPAQPGRDPAAGVAPKLGAGRETFVDTLPRPVPPAVPSAQTPLERLREMAGSELVRASTLVLKDGGGEIRLVLKPESLGSVRIRMNVVDNAIEGRIIVDSAAVKHVFEGSVDALRRALTAEGFHAGSLQVSVGGQNTDADERRRQEETPAVRKIVVQGFERNVPGVENVSLGDLFVNLFV